MTEDLLREYKRLSLSLLKFRAKMKDDFCGKIPVHIAVPLRQAMSAFDDLGQEMGVVEKDKQGG